MHDTAHAPQIATQPNPQLALGTGPSHVIARGRPRTGPDDAWLQAARTEAQEHLSDKPSLCDRTDLAVLDRVSWLSSCNDDRAFFGSVDGLAAYLRMGRRTAQRSLSRWEARGVFEFRHRKGGRPSQSSRGRFNVLVLKLGQHGRLNPATVADRFKSTKIQEGRVDQNLNLLTCDAQSKGITLPASSTTKDQDIVLSGLPSQGQEKANAPVAEEPVFVHPKQVGMLYSVARKLGKPISDEEALRFDDMPHEKKKWILDPMLATEQQASMEGLVPPPPPKLVPQFVVGGVRKSVKKPSQENCRHVWHGPDSDRLFVCAVCAEERGQIQVPARSGGDR